MTKVGRMTAARWTGACVVAFLLTISGGSNAQENLALDKYSCADFLQDTTQPGNGNKLLRSLMMISWATGYASGTQQKFARADAGAFMLMAGALGEACRKEPALKAVQVIARLVQQSSLDRQSTANPPDSGTLAPSRWEQNGSIFYLTNDGPARRIYFESPRPDLVDIGVKKGALLFEGNKVGNKYEGTAYAFARSCDAKAYDARGDISADEKQVVLSGRAPEISSSCKIVGYRDVFFVFKFIPSGAN